MLERVCDLKRTETRPGIGLIGYPVPKQLGASGFERLVRIRGKGNHRERLENREGGTYEFNPNFQRSAAHAISESPAVHR